MSRRYSRREEDGKYCIRMFEMERTEVVRPISYFISYLAPKTWNNLPLESRLSSTYHTHSGVYHGRDGGTSPPRISGGGTVM